MMSVDLERSDIDSRENRADQLCSYCFQVKIYKNHKLNICYVLVVTQGYMPCNKLLGNW